MNKLLMVMLLLSGSVMASPPTVEFDGCNTRTCDENSNCVATTLYCQPQQTVSWMNEGYEKCKLAEEKQQKTKSIYFTCIRQVWDVNNIRMEIGFRSDGVVVWRETK